MLVFSNYSYHNSVIAYLNQFPKPKAQNNGNQKTSLRTTVNSQSEDVLQYRTIKMPAVILKPIIKVG